MALQALDLSITIAIQPVITSHFNAPWLYAWIGATYMLAEACSTSVLVGISDIFGRKTILLLSVLLFALGSVLCAASTSPAMFLAGRAVQGSAPLMSLANVCIGDMFSQRDRGFYLSLSGAVWAVCGGAGPAVGAALAQFASWRWIWWINLPISAFALVQLIFFLDIHNPRTPLKEGALAIDWAGSLAILGVTVMVLLGIDFGGVTYVSPFVKNLLIGKEAYH